MPGGRLRILHTESSLGWGGQEIRILTEARGMLDRGHDVTLACPIEAKIHDQAAKYGVAAVALPIGRKRLGGLLAMRSWIAAHRHELDVVNTHSSTDSWLVALACASLAGAPAVVRTRHLSTAIDRSVFTRWLYLHGCRHIVTTGERIREQLHRDNGFPLDCMTSVPTGIALDRYRPGDRRAARVVLGIADKPALGIVATLRGWKGHREMLDAWHALRNRFPDWQLIIVGDGPQWENLRTRIASEGLGDRVTMAGNRDNVEEWLRALDVFVLPSWGNEGVPQGIMQAMATALPVVSTTVGAIDEAVVNSETGFLVEPKDARALEARLDQLMADPTLRERMGQAGHARAQARFGTAVMLDKMEAVFRDAIARGSKRVAADRDHATDAIPGEEKPHVAYLYNEILPKRSAHDVYVFRTAAALAEAGAAVSLLHGAGSDDMGALHRHYQTAATRRLRGVRLPIVRRNFGLRITLNAVFNHAAQRWIRRHRPDWVVLSVLKQGKFHLARRVPDVRYAYEVHELAWYPGRDATDGGVARRIAIERQMLSDADLVIVTTAALRDILRAAPYGIATRIEIVPLAAPAAAPAIATTPATTIASANAPAPERLRLAYVGQLYREQGISLLLQALAQIEDVELDVFGGQAQEIAALRGEAQSLRVDNRVRWHGFVAPASLPLHVARADAFVAPFLAEGRMPYVAHTKLLEYVGWRRPVIVPDLPVVREHFDSGGIVCFRAGDTASLAEAIRSIIPQAIRETLKREIAQNTVCPDAGARGRRYLDILKG